MPLYVIGPSGRPQATDFLPWGLLKPEENFHYYTQSDQIYFFSATATADDDGRRPLIDTDKKPFLTNPIRKDDYFDIKQIVFGRRQPKLAIFEK